MYITPEVVVCSALSCVILFYLPVIMHDIEYEIYTRLQKKPRVSPDNALYMIMPFSILSYQELQTNDAFAL